MDKATVDLVLDETPGAATIRHLREQAADRGESAIATFTTPERDAYHLVVSSRGTCVLLQDGVTVQTFNPSFSDDDVADALLAEDA